MTCLGQKVNGFLGFTHQGSQFMFGYLVNQQPFIPPKLGKGSIAFNVTMEINEHKAIMAPVFFKALSTVYFFSFVVGMLSHYGVVQV